MEVILALLAIVAIFYFIFFLGPQLIADKTGRPVHLKVGRFNKGSTTYPKSYKEAQKKQAETIEIIKQINDYCSAFDVGSIGELSEKSWIDLMKPTEFEFDLDRMMNRRLSKEAERLDEAQLGIFLFEGEKIILAFKNGVLTDDEMKLKGQLLYGRCLRKV